MRQGALAGFMLMLTVVSGCEPAKRYPPPPRQGKKSDEEIKKFISDSIGWMKPTPPLFDVPIVFVPDSDPEWAKLPAFWNYNDKSAAGLATSHLGQVPLGAMAALVIVSHGEAVKIKVPRGLPDPTPHIPASNPPTLAKWRLGKSLFYDPILPIPDVPKASCAYCHDPKHGFCDDWPIANFSRFNALSLINCVYNKHQFWDGRVDTLEQVLVRELDDENVVGERRARDHIWSGLVSRLRDDPAYEDRFREVFGVKPTQDNIAKSLATFMRTILSGNSVYDRAQVAKGKDADLGAKHFETALTSADNALGQGTKVDAAKGLSQGYNLFRGKARCQLCHSGPLFTDHDFHNVGLDDAEVIFQVGRFARVPPGMKENRLRGAFKTPTLRNLPRTEPYMHNGMFKTLDEVVGFFDHGVKWQDSLASQLSDGQHKAQRLSLTEDEKGHLVLFLRALDGDSVDPIVLAPEKKK